MVAYYDDSHISTAMRHFLDITDEFFKGGVSNVAEQSGGDPASGC